MEYYPTIGLEIHAELKTKTKMFCQCLNDPDENHPNINICPICSGHPGTLPVMNKEAIKKVIQMGLALNCEINQHSKFDRKNYFYPDLPKGYQISQYDLPFCVNGKINLFLSDNSEISEKEISITRIHLEEDAGKLIHDQINKNTLIDLNRAGVALLELVTEPEVHSAEEAKLFGQSLQLILRYLDASDADMEKGQMRVEVNISLSSKEDALIKKYGTKVEVKNLNSFRSVERAIEFEIQRQTEMLDSKEKIKQETRGWDDVKGITYSQRSKEEAQDYRYFPEPDLPPITVFTNEKETGLFDFDELKMSLPELPWEKKTRLISQLNISASAAINLIQEPKLADFLEKCVSETQSDVDDQTAEDRQKIISLCYNYLTSDLKGLMALKGAKIEELRITPASFSQLISLIYNNKVSSRGAKNILEEMFKTGKEPHLLIKEMNLEQVSDESTLKSVILEIINQNPKVIAEFKNGKMNSLQFLIGQAMAKTKGAADPQILKDLFLKELQN